MPPDHEALNIAMAVSLVASTGDVALLPFYVRNMLPPSFVSTMDFFSGSATSASRERSWEPCMVVMGASLPKASASK